MAPPSLEYTLSGPDPDGLYWLEYEGDEPICLGEWEEAHSRLMRIFGEDPKLGEFQPPN